jgi:hypothetical protein
MTKRSLLLTLAAGCILAVTSLVPSFAADMTQPLASFTQTGPDDPFHYTDNSPGFATFTASTMASLHFTTPVGALTGTFNNLALTLNGDAVAPVGVGPNQAIEITQMQFVATTGPNTGKTILSMTALPFNPGGNGGFYGPAGSSASSMLGVDNGNSLGANGVQIVFHSDLVSDALLNGNPADYPITPDVARVYSLSMSMVSPLTIDGSTINFLSNIGEISGNYRFFPVEVPEPGTVAMLIGLGTSGSLLGLRRLRRK